MISAIARSEPICEMTVGCANQKINGEGDGGTSCEDRGKGMNGPGSNDTKLC